MKINDYKLLKLIGKGSYGEVWLSKHTITKKTVAIKIERKNINSKLKYETTIIRYLNELKMVPNIKYFGEHKDFNFLIMDLLGIHAEKYIKEKIIAKGVIEREYRWIALKMLECIKCIHEKGIIHRDIKPENFVLSLDEKELYIIDFGLAKQLINKNGSHMKKKKIKSIIGTLRYVSKNVHDLLEPSRRDDLISMSYILIYFIVGRLPWQGIKGNNKINEIGNIKNDLHNNEILNKIPLEIKEFYEYCGSLEFDELPNYEYLKCLLTQLYK